MIAIELAGSEAARTQRAWLLAHGGFNAAAAIVSYDQGRLEADIAAARAVMGDVGV